MELFGTPDTEKCTFWWKSDLLCKNSLFCEKSFLWKKWYFRDFSVLEPQNTSYSIGPSGVQRRGVKKLYFVEKWLFHKILTFLQKWFFTKITFSQKVPFSVSGVPKSSIFTSVYKVLRHGKTFAWKVAFLWNNFFCGKAAFWWFSQKWLFHKTTFHEKALFGDFSVSAPQNT